VNVLTRALVSVLAAGLAAVLMLAAGQQAALAGGGPGGGNLVGSVTCGQSYSPQCEVTAGTSALRMAPDRDGLPPSPERPQLSWPSPCLPEPPVPAGEADGRRVRKASPAAL